MTILKHKKNILSVFLAITLIASFNIYFYPSTARAVMGVADTAAVTIVSNTNPGTLAAEKAALSSAISGKGDFGQKLLEWSKILLGIALKRAILDKIVDQTVAWIQSDFEKSGRPAFLQDPETFKKQVVNDAVGAAIQSIVPGLCSPFSVKLQIGVVSPAELSQPFTCTLNQVVKNINNFEDEFKQSGKGRWIKYAAIWEPQNNIWGATIMAESLKEKTITEAVQAENLSQTINVGFYPVETCTQKFLPKDVPCKQGDPYCVCELVPGTGEGQTSCLRVENVKCTSKIPGCDCKIKTPGNFIASEVFKIGGSDTPKNAILSANDVATYVGTLMDALISHYTQLGMKGLMGVLYPTERIDPCKDSVTGEPKECWDTSVRKAFSALDAMTYNNTRTMYVDEINNVLTVKNSSLREVDALIDQQKDLDKLAVINTCPATIIATTATEASKIRELVAVIVGQAEKLLNDLTDLKDGIENDIDDMNSVKSDMQNSVYPATLSDPSGQAEQHATLNLLSGYQDLKDRKILDIDAANKESEFITRHGETIRLTASQALSTYDALADRCITANAAAVAAAAAAGEN